MLLPGSSAHPSIPDFPIPEGSWWQLPAPCRSQGKVGEAKWGSTGWSRQEGERKKGKVEIPNGGTGAWNEGRERWKSQIKRQEHGMRAGGGRGHREGLCSHGLVAQEKGSGFPAVEEFLIPKICFRKGVLKQLG